MTNKQKAIFGLGVSIWVLLVVLSDRDSGILFFDKIGQIARDAFRYKNPLPLLVATLAWTAASYFVARLFGTGKK